MRALKSLAVFGILCVLGFGLTAGQALAEHGWTEDPPQNGKPEDPPNPAVGPTYGLPMTLDADPWVDPPQKGKPADPVVPSINPQAWWMQMALDDTPWAGDPPKKNNPKF